MSDREASLLASVTESSRRFYLWVGGLSVVVLWGIYAYVLQLRHGLIVTGLGDQIAWGLYITNFVFFVDIAKGGTLLSAALRLSRAEWRRPITRLAEAMALISLCIAIPMILMDVGRPERALSLLRYGRIQSTIIWDVVAVATYLCVSVVYLYLPLIPDLATVASQPGVPRWRRRLYRTLSVGWTGSAEHCQLLNRAIGIMTVVVIPLVISVNTSWIFAMTLRPGWNTAILGPSFVMAALYSGCAVVLISMYVFRRVLRLEDYIGLTHFRNLGALLLVFCVFFLYFNINEYLTMGYKSAAPERGLLERLFSGDYASYFWTTELLAKPLPLLLLAAVLFVNRLRPLIIPGTVLAALSVVVALWLEHFVIVVPTLASPLLPMQGIPEEWMHYHPTWVEWSVTIAAFALLLLLYSLLSKLFPLISIWETRAEQTAPAREERAVAFGQPQPSLPRLLSAVFLGCLLTGAASAYAQEPSPEKPGKATLLSLQTRILPPVSPQPAGPKEVGTQPEEPFSPIALEVLLRDPEGKPLGFQVVRFAMKTSFGSELDFGGRPTDEEGKVQLILHDRRCGKHLVKASYAGNAANAAAVAETIADFGPCPPPGMPEVGILMTPYRTPSITLPFLGFYGFIWAAVFYSLGYLVLWRIRRSGAGATARLSGKGSPVRSQAIPPLSSR